jgi:glutathione S-transferase
MVQVLRHVGDPAILAEYPNLKAYIARGMARPAFGRALADLRAGLTGKPPAGWPQ